MTRNYKILLNNVNIIYSCIKRKEVVTDVLGRVSNWKPTRSNNLGDSTTFPNFYVKRWGLFTPSFSLPGFPSLPGLGQVLRGSRNALSLPKAFLSSTADLRAGAILLSCLFVCLLPGATHTGKEASLVPSPPGTHRWLFSHPEIPRRKGTSWLHGCWCSCPCWPPARALCGHTRPCQPHGTLLPSGVTASDIPSSPGGHGFPPGPCGLHLGKGWLLFGDNIIANQRVKDLYFFFHLQIYSAVCDSRISFRPSSRAPLGNRAVSSGF